MRRAKTNLRLLAEAKCLRKEHIMISMWYLETCQVIFVLNLNEILINQKCWGITGPQFITEKKKYLNFLKRNMRRKKSMAVYTFQQSFQSHIMGNMGDLNKAKSVPHDDVALPLRFRGHFTVQVPIYLSGPVSIHFTWENLFNFYPCVQLKFEKLLSWIPIWSLFH